MAGMYLSGGPVRQPEPDWPDEVDLCTGAFTYFGDNRSPGVRRRLIA
jgi:hypothetical protein